MRPIEAPRLSWIAIVLTAVAVTAAAASPATPADAGKSGWPQYRGPASDGVSAETGLLKTWPEAGPKVLWKVPLGGGYSGMSVVGNRLYTMYSGDGDESLGCYGTDDGKQIWRLKVDATRSDDMGDGPRSTPTVDGDLVYGLGAQGMLVAARAATGEKLWEKDLKAAFGARVPQWGISTSPVVEGDLLLMDAGGAPGKSLVALDKKSGEIRWTAYTDRPGYSTPLGVEIQGVRQILSFAGSSLVSVAPADGKVLWSVPWKTSYDVNAAMPVFVPPDKVFISSSYDTGGALYAVKKSGDTFDVSEVWKNRTMKNHFNSSIFNGGNIYGFDDATLKCVDAATGQEKWSQRGFQKGSLLLADGHLIIFSEDGLLALAEATTSGYKEKARAQILEGRTWTMPTLAGKKLYLRNQKEMVALDLAG